MRGGKRRGQSAQAGAEKGPGMAIPGREGNPAPSCGGLPMPRCAMMLLHGPDAAGVFACNETGSEGTGWMDGWILSTKSLLTYALSL